MSLKILLQMLLSRVGRREHVRDGSIGLIAIMKNESMNIREWVDHYKWQGVDKIFLIDNGSDDNSRGLIDAEIRSGFISYHLRPERHKQVEHYRAVYREARVAQQVEWLLVADLDEFIYSPLGTLKKALEVLGPDADLIYMNWQLFGSNGQVDHPKSIRRALVMRQPGLHRHCNSKWICRTKSIYNADAIGIHKVDWVNSSRTISDNSILKLNHYVTQSVEYYTEVKMKRGDASSNSNDRIRDMTYFDEFNKNMSVLDDELVRVLDGQRSDVLHRPA